MKKETAPEKEYEPVYCPIIGWLIGMRTVLGSQSKRNRKRKQ